MKRFGLGLLGCVAVAFTACEQRAGGDGNSMEPPADTAGAVPEKVAVELSAECVDQRNGYTVRYPEGWQVNSGEVMSPCSLFDPEVIQVPRDSEIPIDIAIMLDIESVAFDTLAGDVLGRRDLGRDSMRVDGREAIRIDAESTGEGLHDAGTRSYHYFVNLGESTFVGTTYDAGRIPFERKRRLLDGMMASLRFLEQT